MNGNNNDNDKQTLLALLDLLDLAEARADRLERERDEIRREADALEAETMIMAEAEACSEYTCPACRARFRYDGCEAELLAPIALDEIDG